MKLLYDSGFVDVLVLHQNLFGDSVRHHFFDAQFYNDINSNARLKYRYIVDVNDSTVYDSFVIIPVRKRNPCICDFVKRLKFT